MPERLYSRDHKALLEPLGQEGNTKVHKDKQDVTRDSEQVGLEGSEVPNTDVNYRTDMQPK